MNEKKQQIKVTKTDAVSGISSTIGAAIGVVAGNAISSEMRAAGHEAEVVDARPAEPTPQATRPAPEPQPEPGPVPEAEPEIEVLSYETITNDDGSQMDLAVVNIEGQPVFVGDLNQDGIADVLLSDTNQNGVIEENEVLELTEQTLAMAPLREAAQSGGSGPIAQNDPEPDYINDADVNDYMA